jgi:hypothetical protein
LRIISWQNDTDKTTGIKSTKTPEAGPKSEPPKPAGDFRVLHYFLKHLSVSV